MMNLAQPRHNSGRTPLPISLDTPIGLTRPCRASAESAS